MSYHAAPPQYLTPPESPWTALARRYSVEAERLASGPFALRAFAARWRLRSGADTSPVSRSEESRLHAPGPADGAAAGGLT